MQACPQCQTLLETWEVFCHSCGRVISLEQVPVVKASLAGDLSLEESFQDWFKQGGEALERNDFEKAAVCLQEALRRTSALPNSRTRELEVRSLLGQALSASNKLAEAAGQFKVIAEKTADVQQRKEMSEQVERLKSAAVADSFTAASNQYRAAQAFELKLVPLYCAACKRPLTEGELYGFRRGLVEAPRCVCGVQGPPLVKRTVDQVDILKKEESRRVRKAKLVEAASGQVPGGKDRKIAVLLAVLLGAIGGHKFYLGERAAGILSALLSWTLLPWLSALYDAVQLATMSDVSFNLQYNIEEVLNRLPAEADLPVADTSLFSMEISEDPEDFIDDLSGTEAPSAKVD
jgi:TM2 domain-containing membrane protein YozV